MKWKKLEWRQNPRREKQYNSKTEWTQNVKTLTIPNPSISNCQREGFGIVRVLTFCVHSVLLLYCFSLLGFCLHSSFFPSDNALCAWSGNKCYSEFNWISSISGQTRYKFQGILNHGSIRTSLGCISSMQDCVYFFILFIFL